MIDLVIIGGGPAGITAAMYALRAGLSVTICEKNVYGGQTSIIENVEKFAVGQERLVEVAANKDLTNASRYVIEKVK